MSRVGGTIRVSVNGREVRAKGAFTYNLGVPKREAVIGSGFVHGYSEKPQVAYIEGAVTDTNDLDLRALCSVEESTIILELANKKNIVLRRAYFAADGEGSTDEGEVKVRFESASPGEEIR